MIKSGAVSNLDMTVDMDSIEQSIRMAEQQLNSELSKLNSILELHVTKSQNQSDMVRRSMVNAKWLDLRHEIEALALILLLRVTVSDISFDKKSGDQASDLKNLILRALNWMRHPIYQAYEMDVGSTGLPTLRLSDILFKLLESSEEKIDLFPSFLFPDARWASALTELVENHWSGLSSVLTRAWHQVSPFNDSIKNLLELFYSFLFSGTHNILWLSGVGTCLKHLKCQMVPNLCSIPGRCRYISCYFVRP
jgi:hypothetical protein